MYVYYVCVCVFELQLQWQLSQAVACLGKRVNCEPDTFTGHPVATYRQVQYHTPAHGSHHGWNLLPICVCIMHVGGSYDDVLRGIDGPA